MLEQAQAWLTTGLGSPLANLLTIITAIMALSATISGGFYALVRRRLRHNGAVIARLQDDLARRTDQLDRSARDLKLLQENYERASGRLPEAIIEKIEDELHDRNDTRAHYVARDWLKLEGQAISNILALEAKWAVNHAAGDTHVACMVAAEAFASAAHAIWPQDDEMAELAIELRKVGNDIAVGDAPTVRYAVTVLDAVDPQRLLGGQLVDLALDLERRAQAMEARALFRLAFIQIEQAAKILREELGKTSRPFLRVTMTKVQLLLWLGHPFDALPEIKEVSAVFLQVSGPLHPDTLASRFLLAQVLDRLGRAAEALPVIEDVAAKQAVSPDLGPLHPSTLSRTSRNL